MTEFTLVIGNKNYSSWSLRPWLVLKQLGIEFTEIRIPLYTAISKEEILRYSPAGKVPVLLHNTLTVWESLSICEYLAECFPEANLWPREKSARSHARSISAEMHAGFAKLRQAMGMNCRARLPGKGREPGVDVEIQRIQNIWQECRQQYGTTGDFLFGHFTIADAMFAPVVLRFMTYEVELDPVSEAYSQTMLSLPAMQDWVTAGSAESERIEQFEY
jgi:glutathione S-transferase